MAEEPTISAEHFRRTMGHHPTGVALVTATTAAPRPVGMVVGTVTSVSLDPPLVSFMPAVASTTWPAIEASGSFCINVLGADQERICRAFGTRADDRFSSESWTVQESGSPVLDGAVAWIDCEIETVVRAGDHFIVIGKVLAMAASEVSDPLLFLRGGYGSFIARAQVAAAPEFAPFVGAMDRMRPHLEVLARRFGCECVIGGRADDDLVVLASAGGGRGSRVAGLVGTRMSPVAPLGRTLFAWASEQEVARWITKRGDLNVQDVGETLNVVRDRGYSVSIHDSSASSTDADATGILDPGIEAGLTWSGTGAVHSLSAPIFDVDGRAEYVLAMYGLDALLPHEAVLERANALVSTARALSSPGLLHERN